MDIYCESMLVDSEDCLYVAYWLGNNVSLDIVNTYSRLQTVRSLMLAGF